MSSFFDRLIERRVPQYMLVYIGVAWGIMQFVQFIVDVFLLSPHWTRVVVFAALMLWPGYVLFVYNHGRPGPDKWRLAEKISIPANVLVVAVTILFLFRGQDLGAATTPVVVQDEDGNVIERNVPKAEFKKRALLFDFDPVQLADGEEWLSSFVAEAVVLEMYSDEFFDPVSPQTVADRMVRAGYPDQSGLPLSLKLELAEETKSAWIFSGDIGRAEEGGYTLVTRLHRVADGELVAERRYSGEDIYGLLDRISIDLAGDLDIPGRGKVRDLPVAEYYTQDLEALADYVNAGIAVSRGNDYPRAIALLNEALDADPAFTLARFALSRALVSSNRVEEATASLRNVLDRLYELPDRLHYVVKSDYYFFTREIEKAFAVVEMWAELYPEDQQALANLFSVQNNRGQTAEAIGTLERLFELNAGLADVLKQIAALHSQLGNFDAAEDAVRRYIDLYPDDVSGILTLAEIQITTGRLDAGRSSVDKASLMEPTNVRTLLLEARITGAQGDFQETEDLYTRALALAATPAEKVNVYSNMQFFYQAYGRTGQAIERLNDRLREAGSFQPPLQVVQSRLTELTPYLSAGRVDEARAIVDSVRTQLQPPYDIVASIGDIELGLHEEDVAKAQSALERLEAFIQSSGIGNLRRITIRARAEIAELDEDWNQALAGYRELLDTNPGDVTVRTDIARCLRRLGWLSEARGNIDEALRLIPANATAHLELSYILEAQGERDAARDAVEQALAVWSGADPTFRPAAEARERLAAL